METQNKETQEVQKPKPTATAGTSTPQPPAMGRIVLVRLNNGSDRAMRITKIVNPTTVNGVIYLDGWEDRGTTVPGVREGSLHSWASGLKRGSEVNQWRFFND